MVLRLIKRHYIRPLIGLIVGLFVFLELSIRYGKGAESLPKVRALVAARRIEAGEKLGMRDFTMELKPRRELPSDVVTDQELFLVSTSVLRGALNPGDFLTVRELISDAHALASRIPKGARAHILRFENAIPVFSGNTVDVFLGAESDPVAEGLVVLRANKGASGTIVVVAARPREIIELERAREKGKLILAIRNPDDTQRSKPDFPRVSRKTHRNNGITIMTEGTE